MAENSFSREAGLAWIAPRWRADVAAQPEKVQLETLEGAVRLAAQCPQSYLARHLRALYGIKRGLG